MLCPECDRGTTVASTRVATLLDGTALEGSIRRQRKCLHCNEKIITIEVQARTLDWLIWRADFESPL